MTRAPLLHSICRRAWLVAPLAALSCAGLGTAASPAAAGSAGVIVRARPGSEAAAESLARRLGGTVRRRLQIVDGFSATLPARAVRGLEASGLVVSVTANRRLAAQGSSYSGGYDPNTDG